MKKMKTSRAGCLVLLTAVFLIAMVASMFRQNSRNQSLSSDGLSWADAAEKCKAKYKSQRPEGVVKVSNCKKRTEDDDFFYFSWRKPLSIFIRNSNGGQVAYSGTCRVSRKSGEIVHLTLDKKVLVDKAKK
ncbi:MAG: hypothetical protein U9R57_16730 [Thermodesulfobacteriota bacterium]|nr:hypothetical protein [Thermodesulfobacteriota bacterium]